MGEPGPLVSVVIPAYNGEAYLAEAIDSVLAQTYRPLEVVVVDDGSADGSRALAEGFADRGPVSVVAHDHNRGIAAARNTGVRHGTGEFVAFLDQDDLWRPGKLAEQVAVLQADGAAGIGLVFTDVDAIDGSGDEPAWRYTNAPAGVDRMSRDALLMALFDRNFVLISSVLVRRGCIDEVGMLREDIVSGVDDYEFFVRVAERYRFARIERPLTVRRVHGGNFTDLERFYPDVVRVVDGLAQRYPDVPFRRRRRHGELLYTLGRARMEAGDLVAARTRFRESLRTYPRSYRSAIALVLSSLGPVGGAVVRAYRRVRIRLRRRRT